MPLAEFYVRLENNNILDDGDNLAFKFGRKPLSMTQC